MSGCKLIGQDVRFHSNLVWAWWPDTQENNKPECLNGSTGLLHDYDNNNKIELSSSTSLISTISICKLIFHDLLPIMIPNIYDDISYLYNAEQITLVQLCKWKNDLSPNYENAKKHLLTKHCVFKYWSRRRYAIASS